MACVLSFTCTPRIRPLTELTIPAFSIPAKDGLYLPTPEGWMAWVGQCASCHQAEWFGTGLLLVAQLTCCCQGTRGLMTDTTCRLTALRLQLALSPTLNLRASIVLYYTHYTVHPQYTIHCTPTVHYYQTTLTKYGRWHSIAKVNNQNKIKYSNFCDIRPGKHKVCPIHLPEATTTSATVLHTCKWWCTRPVEWKKMVGFLMVSLQHRYQVSAGRVLMTKMLNLYYNTVVNINVYSFSFYMHYYHTVDFHSMYLTNIKQVTYF